MMIRERVREGGYIFCEVTTRCGDNGDDDGESGRNLTWR